MDDLHKPKLVGLNHIVLEVGDLTAALDFYHAIFAFRLRGREDHMAFLDMGDQFLVLAEGRDQSADKTRHFGLVVDDRSTVPDRVEAAGGRMLDTPFVDFLDPWGNRVQVVEYRDLQFTKTDAVLEKLGVSPDKSADALAELDEKGLR